MASDQTQIVFLEDSRIRFFFSKFFFGSVEGGIVYFVVVDRANVGSLSVCLSHPALTNKTTPTKDTATAAATTNNK